MQRFLDLRRRSVLALAIATAAQTAVTSELPRVMNRFAELWNQFVAGANKGLFDAKLAKKISRAWREVENSGEWPKG